MALEAFSEVQDQLNRFHIDDPDDVTAGEAHALYGVCRDTVKCRK